MDLQHAKRYSLSQLSLEEQLTLAVTLTPTQSADISLFGLSSRRKLRDDGYMVFYNQKASPNNEITIQNGENQEDQRFVMDVSSLPAHVTRLLIVITPEGDALSTGEGIVDLIDQHGNI
ncbi:TerD family protein [Deinococcus aquaticus]|uniref:TerD family protein n=1 Tax=Deinococcus aquaticus TaxID=328692 RepID=UPI003F473A8A